MQRMLAICSLSGIAALRQRANEPGEGVEYLVDKGLVVLRLQAHVWDGTSDRTYFVNGCENGRRYVMLTARLRHWLLFCLGRKQIVRLGGVSWRRL